MDLERRRTVTVPSGKSLTSSIQPRILLLIFVVGARVIVCLVMLDFHFYVFADTFSQNELQVSRRGMNTLANSGDPAPYRSP